MKLIGHVLSHVYLFLFNKIESSPAQAEQPKPPKMKTIEKVKLIPC
jgi:hypothetical protein